MKLIGSTVNELVNLLPYKEHQNNSVWETNLLEKFSGEDSIFLQTAANEDSFQRMTEKEIQTSEVQPDVLSEKIIQDCVLSQGSKTEQVTKICLIWFWMYFHISYKILGGLLFGYALISRKKECFSWSFHVAIFRGIHMWWYWSPLQHEESQP